MSKAIKRIVALGTGITMVGATILGAMAAADLSNYPEPFVDLDEGAFNALLVVGSKAAADDIVGAIDIAASLQYATRVMTPIPGASATATVSGEGVKIEGSSSELELGQEFVEVKSKIDADDLPNMLADGVYVADGDNGKEKYDFTQELVFGDLPAVNWQTHDEVDDNEVAHLLVLGESDEPFMEYTLSFTQDAESAYGDADCSDDEEELCDFKDTVISFMGMDYEITDANYDGTDISLEMMGGLGTYSMYEGETQTFEIDGEDYEVTVDIVSDTGFDCVLTVNGETTDELKKGESTTVAGVSLGIKKLMPNEAGEEDAGKDYVQFYLGANQLTLSDGDKVELGEEEVDDVIVTFVGSGDGETYTLEEIVFTWTPEEDIVFGAGEEVEFPLGGFNVAFSGMTEPESPEEIEFAPSGDETIEMTVPLYKASVTMDFIFWDEGAGAMAYGVKDTELIYMAADTISKKDYVFCSDEEESHILQLIDVDPDNVVWFKDMATGKDDIKGTDSISVGECDLTLAGADTDTNEVDVDGDVSNVLYTAEGLAIVFDTVTVGAISLYEETEEGTVYDPLDPPLLPTINLAAETTGDASDVDVAAGGTYDSTHLLDVADDVKAVTTTFGTYVSEDTSDDDFVTIEYPGEMLYPEVFVNGEDATIVSGGAGTYEEVQRISAGMAKLDSEISDIEAQNLIVVGGPCVNTIAAQLLGNPAECTEGFEPGKAMIKLFEQGGNVAMLVAGYEAADTTRATRVVAEYDSDEFSGDFDGTELEVTGTSISDISVSAPQ